MSIGSNASRVTVVDLDQDALTVVTADGTQVKHVVGQQLMVRVIDLPPGASVQIADTDAEHTVSVLEGEVEVVVGEAVSSLALELGLIRQGTEFSIRSRAGARCQLTSTPPNALLVQELLHLEHEGHGFD